MYFKVCCEIHRTHLGTTEDFSWRPGFFCINLLLFSHTEYIVIHNVLLVHYSSHVTCFLFDKCNFSH